MMMIIFSLDVRENTLSDYFWQITWHYDPSWFVKISEKLIYMIVRQDSDFWDMPTEDF